MTWTNEKARAVYNFAHWGGGYFDVHEGHLHARPSPQDTTASIDLHRLADDIQQAGLELPVLVRFPDILRDRVHQLSRAFATAIETHHYQGRFTAVYPIKVNQQFSVVSELLAASDAQTRVGLECGSKPELLAVLALSIPGGSPDGAPDKSQGTIICNGYKDREYIRLALIGQQLGHRITIVLEKPAELALVIEESARLAIRPRLGLRLRLASIGKGNWQNTGGEKSKFGLSAAQALQVIERLQQAGMLDCLGLLHCHMGSQLSNIRDIQQGLREIARYYVELHRMGVKIHCIDVGGGLGIDYEGSRSRNLCSMNYSLQEYANNVVHTLWEACDQHRLPHPDIITESGRALTAHHALLITDVIDVEKIGTRTTTSEPDVDAPVVLHDLWNGLCAKSDPRTAIETYHTAAHWLAEAHNMYVHGVLSMPQKAQAEELYFAICRQVQQQLDPAQRAHRAILDELSEKLADKVFCNFSLFQSLPDVWAIDQIFPIVPLSRLDEEPSRRATLQDITCDSDGRIDHYVDGEGIDSSLLLHDISADENYRLGFFLIGAYQEILGDMHNLFGDTNAVDVRLDAEGQPRLEHFHHGDTVDSVLRVVHFDAQLMLDAYRQQLQQGTLNADQRDQYLAELTAGLSGYTYFKNNA